MKTLILIRFDKELRYDVSKVLERFINENEPPKMIQTPSTVITFFKTESRFKEIYLSIAEIRPITAFLLIDVSKTDVSIHLPEEITKELSEYLGKTIVNKANYNNMSEMSLDELNHCLDEAISTDDFEKAAEIRDIINLKTSGN